MVGLKCDTLAMSVMHPLFLPTCLVEAVEHSICDQTVASVKPALLIV